ncbi:MAG: SMC family ATPase [Halobacteriota archaeon]|jgi:exonuclease SbcC
MKIDSIRLKNIRTFVDSGEIPFGDGTISIYGENGAGKSTIVDCIGRAIFGFDPQGIKSAVIDYRGTKYKQGVVEYLLRKSETDGLIEVKFSNNGKAFRVINRLSRKSPQTWELYIDERNSNLFGKEEIHQRIVDELGISTGYTDSASSLFANVICVQQGKIIDEFEYSAQARKDHFDRVLGLYRYRQAYEDSKHVKNNFKEQATKQDGDVRVLKSGVEHLEKQIESLKEHEDESIILENELKDIDKEKTSLGARKQVLDELSATISKLESELKGVAAQIDALKINQSNVEKDLADSHRAKEIVAANRQSFQRYNEISTELQTVREYLRQITKLQEDHFATQREYDRLGNEKQNKIAELDNFRNAKQRAEGLKKHFDNYKELQDELEKLQNDQREYTTFLGKLDERHKTLNDCDAKINALELQLQNYDALKTEADLLEGLNKEYNDIIAVLGERNGLKRQFEKELVDLIAGICPYTHETCESILELGQKQQQKLEHIQQDLVELESQEKEKSAAIKQATEAEKQLRTLEKKKHELDLLNDQVDSVNTEIKRFVTEIDGLGDSSEAIINKKAHLDKLKPLADEFNSLWYGVQRFNEDAALKEIANVEEKQSQLAQALESIDDETAKLSEAGGNAANEARLSQELNEVKEAHDLYVASLNSAKKLEQLEADCSQIRSKIQDLESQRMELERRALETRGLYDEQEHKRITEELDEKLRVFNEKKGILTQLLKQIDEEKSVESDVKEKKEELMAAEVELKEIEYDAAFFDEIRASFKKLSSLRPVYTREVSKHAERYWSSLAGGESQLFWQEDYLIFKTINDNVISLYEMSGGEKISACLSVRLALQDVIGGLGLFILDEPTIHLDEERRNNLASQIGAIKGLSQVIVISHDDAFHSHTRQQITIQRGPDGSSSSIEW